MKLAKHPLEGRAGGLIQRGLKVLGKYGLAWEFFTLSSHTQFFTSQREVNSGLEVNFCSLRMKIHV